MYSLTCILENWFESQFFLAVTE